MTDSEFGHAASARACASVRHFCPDFTCRSEIDLGGEMGAEPAPTVGFRETRNALIVALVLAAWCEPDCWIAYSRDAGRYRALRRYFGPVMSLRAICWAVATLEQAGLVEHRKTRPSPRARFRSTLRAAKGVISACPISSISDIRRMGGIQTIRLKDESKKRLKAYLENPDVSRWRRDVEAQNIALDGLAITPGASEWRIGVHGLWTDDHEILNPAANQYYRVFNRDWMHGGRWYGPFWQSLPGSARKQLHINGEPVIELDYSALHPRLLAAEAGITLGDADPYEIDGWPRKEVKRAFNVLLNAESRLSAIRALQNELLPNEEWTAYTKAKVLVDAVERRHPDFRCAWGSGKGLRLQAVDAEICGDVQALMRKDGYPVLSVHDSFIAPMSQKPALEAAMDAALTKGLRKIAG